MSRGSPSPGFAGGALGTANGLAAIASSAVAVALPSLRQDLDASVGEVAWVFTAFALAFAATTLVFGRLADLHGSRRPLQAGLAIMAMGSMVCAVAPSLPIVVLGRVIQGAGAGAIPVLAAVTLSSTFAGHARVTAYSRLGIVIAFMAAAGPLIGGLVEEFAGWRTVVALPALAVPLIWVVERIAPTREPRGTFDGRGAILTVVFFSGLVLAIQGRTVGVSLVSAGLVLTTVGGLLLARHVVKEPDGAIPLRVVRRRAIWWPSLAGLTISASYFGVLLAVPALLADRQGWTPLEIGFGLLPAAVLGAIAARVAGAAIPRFGRGPVIIAGTAAALAGVLVGSSAPGQPVAAVLALTGVTAGYGFGQPALLDLIARLVEPAAQGAALGLFTLAFFFGGSVGSAVVGVVSDEAGLAAGLASVLVLAPLGLAGAWRASAGDQTGRAEIAD